jgi:hypothetical protein
LALACLLALAAAAPASAGVLTVQKSPAGVPGTVTSSPAGINCGGDCQQDFPSEQECDPERKPPCITINQSVELTANPGGGFAIQGWTGCTSVSGDNKCTVTMNADKTVTANYADVQDPVATLTAPSAGPKRGTIEIAATASDNSGVARVEFLIDGLPLATDTGAPYSMEFNTTASEDGPRTLSARAVDNAGRIGPQSSVSIEIDNTAPEIDLEGPNGQTFGPGSTQSWTIAATDDGSGISNVQCSVRPSGNAPVFGPCSGGTTGHSVSGLGDGGYVFAVRATDVAGGLTEVTRQFTVDATPPDTTITGGPDDGSSSTATSATYTFASTEAGSTFACRSYASGSAAPAFGPCSSTTGHQVVPPSAGTYVFEVVATDANGNADQTPARRTFTVLPPPALGGASSGGQGGSGTGTGSGPPAVLGARVAKHWALIDETTEVRKLVVKQVGRGVAIQLRCKGEGCPFRSKRIVAKGSSLALTKLFDSPLAPGASIELRITQPGMVGRYFRFVTRDGRAPKAVALCLPPGGGKPTAC